MTTFDRTEHVNHQPLREALIGVISEINLLDQWLDDDTAYREDMQIRMRLAKNAVAILQFRLQTMEREILPLIPAFWHATDPRREESSQ